ncbi:PilZ domain-containing protein [Marinobacter caseinilyticus]|uniref:PilZ domain-containing protein n=1 Tax=Marinobacter caseinilyticus TaxID=2692195 RepID=UPI00140E33DF|nr:PilZ domain-containing protein [Marinobacter caseinilyticus]
MTTSDRRQHTRTALNVKVRVRDSNDEARIFATRDISDGGIFIIVEDGFEPSIGDHLEVQVQGLPVPAPVLPMVVVRKTVDGFGLQFEDQ